MDMFIFRAVIVCCSATLMCGLTGCNSTSVPDGQNRIDPEAYFSVSIPGFGGGGALAVRADAVTFKSIDFLLPDDLLEGIPDEASAIVNAPDVAVMPDENKGGPTASSRSRERHAAVTFRLAAEGTDACVSDVMFGPFGLSIIDNVVSVASASLPLPEAARALILAGRIEVCAQTLADFDGLLAINKLSLQFGKPIQETRDTVELCHIPPGDPENRHTITVGDPAEDAHLAHGDYLGACSEPVEDLVLTSICSDDPTLKRQWQVRNQNSFDVDVTWEVLGTDQAGTVVAQPGDLFLLTDTVGGANTTAIHWFDENGLEHSDSKASGGVQCNPDADNDGVTDDVDTCPDTPAGEEPDTVGCSCSQLDDDADGVDNCADYCPGTPDTEHPDSNGCSCAQLDSDADGVNDCNDACPDTPSGDASDSNGCSCAQLDSDVDGLNDCEDACPYTPTDELPDETGCSCSQRDSDADGVNDCNDACPDSIDPSEVGPNGCPDTLFDEDDDGVLNDDDACPETPVGEPVDDVGCSCGQADEDSDGVNDCDDLCPSTRSGAEVDINGCPAITADAGSDVTLDDVGCLTLQGSAFGGTEPYTYSWSAPGWDGSTDQNPPVMPSAATTYTLTVTDWSSPPQTSVDTVTVSFASSGVKYTIVNLGSPEGNSSYATGLNDSGEVVGYYYTASWARRAFIYGDGVLSDLPMLGGGEAFAEDINNAGVVVGQSKTADQYWHASLWEATGGVQDLGTLGGTASVAYAINESGQVVGHADTAQDIVAFLYSDGVMEDLSALDYVQSAFFDVNDNAQVVGTYVASGGGQGALVVDGDTIVELGSPLLDGSRAVAINNSGLLAGYSWGGGEYRSFLYACETVVDLGVLEAFPKTYAWDVNDAGQVVGSSSGQIGRPSRAFIYTGGTLHELNDLLAPGHGWEYLAAAYGINDVGQIVGYGRIDGEFRAFLMTPVH